MPMAIPPRTPPPSGPAANPEAIRWYVELIVQMVLDYSNQAVKFLSLANSGGAVALLSFMGNSEALRSLPSTWTALTYLIIGFVLAGLVAVTNFFSAMYLGRSGKFQAFSVFYGLPWKSLDLELAPPAGVEVGDIFAVVLVFASVLQTPISLPIPPFGSCYHQSRRLYEHELGSNPARGAKSQTPSIDAQNGRKPFCPRARL